MSDKKPCSEICALYEYKGKKFGVDGCGWAPCEDCVNESEFTYNEGFDPLLDKIYKSGCKDGYREGGCDSVRPCDWD